MLDFLRFAHLSGYCWVGQAKVTWAGYGAGQGSTTIRIGKPQLLGGIIFTLLCEAAFSPIVCGMWKIQRTICCGNIIKS